MTRTPSPHRFQHPLHRAHEEATRMDQALDTGASLDELTTQDDEARDEPVLRRPVPLSEGRMAIRRLEQGDPSPWQRLLVVIEDINQTFDEEGHTLVHLLALRGLGHGVRQAVALGADPGRPNHRGVTPWDLNERPPRQMGYENTRDALREGTIEYQRQVLRAVLPTTVEPDGARPAPARRRL